MFGIEKEAKLVNKCLKPYINVQTKKLKFFRVNIMIAKLFKLLIKYLSSINL